MGLKEFDLAFDKIEILMFGRIYSSGNYGLKKSLVIMSGRLVSW